MAALMATMAGGQESLPEAAASGSRPPNGPNVLIGDLLLLLGPFAEEEEGEDEGEDEEFKEFCC